jgi:hypothetical protein
LRRRCQDERLGGASTHDVQRTLALSRRLVDRGTSLFNEVARNDLAWNSLCHGRWIDAIRLVDS